MADPRDAHWFPLEFDAANDAFVLQQCTLASLGDAAFLDQRFVVDRSGAVVLAATEVAEHVAPSSPAWLFHTAFCCSTLLARALHAPPAAVALKEPTMLLTLSTASLAPHDAAWLDARIAHAASLLARPWSEGGRVLVKPTNQVNRLLPKLVALPGAPRAVLLYSSLREFLISCAKKLPAAETRIRWMAQHLLPGAMLQRALGVPANHPFNFVESCVLTWYAQVERYAQALAGPARERARTLDMDVLLARPEQCVRACASWLGLEHEGLAQRVAAEFSRNSKHTEQPFDPAQRAREKQRVLERYGPLIDQAERWAADAIAPAAQMPRDWRPLEVPS